MKKSVEIIGLPVISITEGRELGMSKSLLIDAKNGTVAAITIEDEDWYRGVKLLPYASVIAIGDDAVTINSSENILTLEDAGDYEAMMDANIKIIGTKAITKSGTIQGKVVEIYVGENGAIEKCEIEGRDGSLSETTAAQISIFGKEVTVIDSDTEKKTNFIAPPSVTPVAAPKPEPAKPQVQEAPKAEAPKAEVKEAPKAEAPKAEVKEAPKAEAPKAEVKEAPKAETPKTEAKEAPKAEPAKPETKEAPKAEAPKAEVKEAPKAEATKPEVKAAPAAQAAAPVDAAAQMADKASEERHRRFMLGKTVTKDIVSSNGIVLAKEGDIVTEEILQKVKMTNMLIQLSMSIR